MEAASIHRKHAISQPLCQVLADSPPGLGVQESDLHCTAPARPRLALGNEGDQAHLSTALRAQQREHFVDAGDQHRPQVMRLRALGCHHTTPGQSRAQRCRIRGICERLGAHKVLVCGGRPGPQTGLRWPTQTRSRSARRLFGTAAYARGGAGCRAWTLHPLAHPRENALALGVRWRASGSASVGWVPDDTVFVSSSVDFSAVRG